MMPDGEKLLDMLRAMHRIRAFEERVKTLYDYQSYTRKGDAAADEYDVRISGVIAGAAHLAIGQEGAEVGVCAALRPGDFVASTHRGHGHAIARGAELGPMMAELMGKATGYSGGCGGSMHIFSRELGLLGGNGIIGAQIPIATGAAFASRYRGERRVAVAFFSDGASNQGTFHEALNMASLWKLPALYVCENNLYAATTPVGIALSIPNVADRAGAYGMPGRIVDGQDVLAVYEAASEAVERAREGGGPTLIECKTYRFVGHAGGGKSPHNNPAELETWKPRDPIALLEKRLLETGQADPSAVEEIRRAASAEADEAVAFGKRSPYPKFEELPAMRGLEPA
jgi:TPP-dependent pyruvate/acetoin dehydrogenase alpha subunit